MHNADSDWEEYNGRTTKRSRRISTSIIINPMAKQARSTKAATRSADAKVNSNFSENAIKMMRKRYLAKRADGSQETPADMFRRVASTLAHVEKNYGANKAEITKYEREFFEIMGRKEYTPAGRTLTNAGGATPLIANCIVLPVMDSMESIFTTLKDASLLQQAGSGLGFDFSHLRPAFTPTKKSNGVASGPVSFLKVYNEAFSVIKQQGRHGANMAMMQIDHPDVLDFIRSKEVEGEIRNFNISVKVTDSFMRQLVEKPDTQWYCEWNGKKTKPHKVLRANNGSVIGVEEVTLTVKELFDEIVNYAWLNGEPGIVFIDEVNRTNPLPGLGAIDCSNPCGEQFLHHYDNCNLGSINLAVFVNDGVMDWNRLRHVTRTATRLMDNVIDLFDFPVQAVTDLAQKNRRIGLGIMGFADMLFQLGIAYNSEEGRKMGERVMKTINEAAHKASRELAVQKGSFPNIEESIYGKKYGKKKDAHRNAALTTVAPTGSISMMYDCSSGIEPNFALSYVKQDKDGLQYHYFNPYFEAELSRQKYSKEKIQSIKDEIIRSGSIQSIQDIPEDLKKIFIVSMDLSAEDHMRMQAAFQKHVDNSISKTINFPNSATKEDVLNGYIMAWKLKCKSATVYRDGSRNIQILNLGTGEGLQAPSELGSGKGRVESTKKIDAPLQELRIDENRLEPKKRPASLVGRTYQIKTGYGNLYITINDDEHGAPFEVFATIGKSGGFFQEQSEAICRMISLALRSSIKVESIIEQLKGIRGPMPVMTSKGTVLSLPDAIGKLIEEHIQGTFSYEEGIKDFVPVAQKQVEKKETIAPAPAAKMAIADYGLMPGCPDCGNQLTLGEGCLSCRSCGFSRCT
ncbi:MAG: adenosylcobalamin-dependent ribonucleoside-diphosphate reductase [Patescibacteria group bacterium]